ncbi:MAG TPA: DegT/DnrJ/EryC1/StrS aminotransferase family protein [Telluria sp.]|nr:DegT/DnrJ/EryC1/StrS aminotransferase family protein [Telluria sp.]
MLNTSFAPWPSFTNEEAELVKEVLLSNQVNYWTGHVCRDFEQEFAAWVGTDFAIALANGTLALDLALKALRVGPGDEVIVTSRTFIASASCVVNAGARPVFADVDRDSQNITAETIEAAITTRTKAIICVHLAGWPCDMDPIMELAARHGIVVIEDCAQAHGARYKGKMVGSIGHIGAWSFCQDKIMSTGGEGGMVTTNCREYWSSMWSFKDHGKSWDAIYTSPAAPGFRFVHDSIGTNWRMIEMQAAIGRIQLRHMPAWTLQRQANAHRITTACAGLDAVRVSAAPAHVEHAYYKLYVFVRPENLAPGWTRDKIVQAINSKGVPCLHGTCSEVYLEKAFENTGYRPTQRLPVAKELGETSLVFLVHPTLTSTDLDTACEVITDVLTSAAHSTPPVSLC